MQNASMSSRPWDIYSKVHGTQYNSTSTFHKHMEFKIRQRSGATIVTPRKSVSLMFPKALGAKGSRLVPEGMKSYENHMHIYVCIYLSILYPSICMYIYIYIHTCVRKDKALIDMFWATLGNLGMLEVFWANGVDGEGSTKGWTL